MVSAAEVRAAQSAREVTVENFILTWISLFCLVALLMDILLTCENQVQN